MNLTFGTHLQLRSFSNVKFENSTRFNKLLVVFVAKTLEKERAEKGFKRFGQTTSTAFGKS